MAVIRSLAADEVTALTVGFWNDRPIPGASGEDTMRVSWSLRKWLGLPSRIALLLGLGALSAAGARADIAQAQPGSGIGPFAQGEQASLGDLLIRTDGERIYLSEGGKQFHELHLADPAQIRVLRELLKNDGAAAGLAGIRLHPMILAGDGGSGFHWAPADKTDRAGKPANSRKLNAPARLPAPEQTPAPRDAKTQGGAEKG